LKPVNIFFGSGFAGIMAPDTRELLIRDPAGSVSIRIRNSELWGPDPDPGGQFITDPPDLDPQHWF
jgi:hypothetical protein